MNKKCAYAADGIRAFPFFCFIQNVNSINLTHQYEQLFN